MGSYITRVQPTILQVVWENTAEVNNPYGMGKVLSDNFAGNFPNNSIIWYALIIDNVILG